MKDANAETGLMQSQLNEMEKTIESKLLVDTEKAKLLEQSQFEEAL